MKQLFNKKRGDEGFTLIEMMIVIAIIGILATIVIRSFAFLASARDSKRISDIRTIQNYLELYYNAEGQYPSTATTWPGFQSEMKTAINVSIPSPTDPAYQYCYDASGTTSYILGAKLETNNTVLNQMSQSLINPPQPCGSYQCGTSTGSYIYCVSPQ